MQKKLNFLQPFKNLCGVISERFKKANTNPQNNNEIREDYNMKKKIVSLMLTTMLVMTSLTGCGGNNAEVATGGAETFRTGTAQELSNNVSEGEDLFSYIQTNFAASALPEDYNQPLYNLPANYVFEFECSEKAGYIAYDAFKVYDNTDYENISGMIYNKNTYENGKITIAPDGALALNENGSYNVNDGTWGSLNQLYLVQYLDLNTGEKLERPIVTPFTIQHDLASPTISQSVDKSNSYKLSWEAVPGAVEYRVYEHFGSVGYKLECTTTNTSVSVEEFNTQQKSENYTELIKNDLKNVGLEVSDDGITFMNRGVKYEDTQKDGYFVVVAVDASGRQSGISNIADVRDVAHRLPYTVSSERVSVNITSVEDIPAYVNVEMVDGSVQKMVIDYHGAQTYTYPDDEYKMTIRAKVANTLFDSFLVELSGMKYADVMADISVVTKREDEFLAKVGGAETPNVTMETTSETDDEIMELIDALPEDVEPGVPESSEQVAEPGIPESSEPVVEPGVPESSEPAVEPSVPESSEPVQPDVSPAQGNSPKIQLLNEVAVTVKQNLETLGDVNVGKMMYATNDLQAWMSMCLIAQSEVIPVPVEVFPDAANIEYLQMLFMESYRQNPTCGFLEGIKFNNEYEAIVVKYVEDPQVRLDKTRQELEAAENIAATVTSDSMSDYEKVLAINEYFRLNASYDHDSTQTDVEDVSVLPEQFWDSHTPYGIICKNYGVCESYSEAFILTARCAGLEAMCDFGTLYGGGHEWNRVKVDGNWCVLDVTNNDTDTVINALFNVTDTQVDGILVSDKVAMLNFNAYAATDATKEYYYVNGKIVDDINQATDMLAQQLQTESIACVRIPGNVSEAEIGVVLDKLEKEKGVLWSQAGVHMNVLCVMK